MNPPKPRTRYHNPKLTRLPRHSLARRIFRRFMHVMVKLIVKLALRATVEGVKNFPLLGPALIVVNHLGDADALLVISHLPPVIDAFAAIDLYYEYPLVGRILDAYGVIWIHRGIPDRHALRAGLKGLAKGRFVAIAPEGRESLTGSLEEGTSGAAFLALRSGVPLVPITFTGTRNQVIYPNLHRLRRSHVSMTVGTAFHIKSEENGTGKEALGSATTKIMEALARQLPEEFRGVYGQMSGQES